MYCTLYTSSDYYDHNSYAHLINQELTNQEVTNQEVTNEELINEELINEELINQEVTNQEVTNQDQEVTNQELTNQDQEVINQEVINEEPINPELTTSQSCLICLAPPNKANPIQKLKELASIVSICKCNPELHISCLTEWVNQTESCPICRTKTTIHHHQQTNKYRKVFTFILVFFNFTTSIFRITTLISMTNIFFLCLYNMYFIYFFSGEYTHGDFINL